MANSFLMLNKKKKFVKLGLWARKNNLSRKLGFVLIACAVFFGLLTYLALTGTGKNVPSPRTILILLNIDMLILLSLGIMLFKKIVDIWIERKKGAIGSKLQSRLVILFGMVAATPTVVVAVFSALFFNIGLQAWFSDRVHTAVKESLVVAEAYLKEHRQNIATDVLTLSKDINKNWSLAFQNPKKLEQILVTHSLISNLDEAVIFNTRGKVIARSGLTFSLRFEEVPFWAIDEANNGEVAILTGRSSDRIRALVKLDLIDDSYLYVGRFVDAKVLTHINRAKKAVVEYESLEGRRANIEITFSMIFTLAALLLLLASMWIGLNFATMLAKPIVELINASEKISKGDLDVKVPEKGYADEISVLCRAFNRMIAQLASQRKELIENNIEINQRRRFMETVLSGVSSGVVGLDSKGAIIVANRSACELLGWDINNQTGALLEEVIPELSEAFDVIKQGSARPFSGQIRVGSVTLMVRLVAERKNTEVVGYVFTFDDITDLEAAQRKAAWADVARRIAHEIKNPLTPIQLSAERLKKRYSKQINEDELDTFNTCTDTIIKHVSNIGFMVDEFSSFARMPAPVFKTENLNEVIKNAVFLQKTAYHDIDFKIDFCKNEALIEADVKQLNQVFTNIIKNAIEAIEANKEIEKGKIYINVKETENDFLVEIRDNGKGLPEKDRDRLTEPYITTRAKGTGLGLAIVKKIMEDHKGTLELSDNENRVGAKITITFNKV